MQPPPRIDVVVVSYNSSETLAGCIAPLVDADGIDVIVVDNASTDGSVSSVADLGAHVIALPTNRGFAHGCNRGREAGTAPYTLFLNPDARIDPSSIRQLAEVLERDPTVGLVGPRIVDQSGSLDYSQRRFPRLRSTYAQALFLHRLFPEATWTDEVVRDLNAYETSHPADWLSGACVLVRRAALEQVGGWNEAFFMYAEDKDLCRRLWGDGYQVVYNPDAVAVHIGGASTPRARMYPMLAASTIRYAELTERRLRAVLFRAGVGLGALTHAVLTSKGRQARVGRLRALLVACSPHIPRDRPPADLDPGASNRDRSRIS